MSGFFSKVFNALFPPDPEIEKAKRSLAIEKAMSDDVKRRRRESLNEAVKCIVNLIEITGKCRCAGRADGGGGPSLVDIVMKHDSPFKEMDSKVRMLLLDPGNCTSVGDAVRRELDRHAYCIQPDVQEQIIRCMMRFNAETISFCREMEAARTRVAKLEKDLIPHDPKLVPNALSKSIKETAEIYVAQAWSHEDAGRFDEAIDAFGKAIELDPDDCNLRFQRAMAKLGQGNYDGVFYDFEEVVKLAKTHSKKNDVYNNEAVSGGYKSVLNLYLVYYNLSNEMQVFQKRTDASTKRTDYYLGELMKRKPQEGYLLATENEDNLNRSSRYVQAMRNAGRAAGRSLQVAWMERNQDNKRGSVHGS